MLDTTTETPRSPAQAEAPRSVNDWLLVAAVAIVAFVVAALTWNAIASDGPTVVQPDLVSGFEYTSDATTGQTVSAGVTTQYFGHSGELFPENEAVPGIEDGYDDTPWKIAKPGVTTTYFGYSGELSPENSTAGPTPNFAHDKPLGDSR